MWVGSLSIAPSAALSQLGQVEQEIAESERLFWDSSHEGTGPIGAGPCFPDCTNRNYSPKGLY